jgi:hypothetical protein
MAEATPSIHQFDHHPKRHTTVCPISPASVTHGTSPGHAARYVRASDARCTDDREGRPKAPGPTTVRCGISRNRSTGPRLPRQAPSQADGIRDRDGGALGEGRTLGTSRRLQKSVTGLGVFSGQSISKENVNAGEIQLGAGCAN